LELLLQKFCCSSCYLLSDCNSLWHQQICKNAELLWG